MSKLDKVHIKRILKLIFVVMVYATYAGAFIYLYGEFQNIKNRSSSFDSTLSSLQQEQENFKANFSEELFNEHLKLMDKMKLESELADLESQIAVLDASAPGSLASTVKEVYDLYGDFQAKVKRNENVKVDVKSSKDKIDSWGELIITKDFEKLKGEIIAENTALDAGYKKYIDSIPKPALSGSGSAANGYSYLTITTERGTSHGVYLIKLPLSQYRVKTIAAQEENCKNNCPTKTLAQYVTENGGYAGINGSYNCPPDYPACAGKTNSFDFAFYDSNDRKWFNKGALSWFETGLFTFRGNSANFYKKSSEFGGDSVDGAISNYPSLVKNSEVVVSDGDLESYQKVKGLRGALGVGGENIFLAHISNASVLDAAYVMKALGVKHALNLDGGGSAAMYINGGYKVGPGRGLSNAIVLVK